MSKPLGGDIQIQRSPQKLAICRPASIIAPLRKRTAGREASATGQQEPACSIQPASKERGINPHSQPGPGSAQQECGLHINRPIALAAIAPHLHWPVCLSNNGPNAMQIPFEPCGTICRRLAVIGTRLLSGFHQPGRPKRRSLWAR